MNQIVPYGSDHFPCPSTDIVQPHTGAWFVSFYLNVMFRTLFKIGRLLLPMSNFVSAMFALMMLLWNTSAPHPCESWKACTQYINFISDLAMKECNYAILIIYFYLVKSIQLTYHRSNVMECLVSFWITLEWLNPNRTTRHRKERHRFISCSKTKMRKDAQTNNKSAKFVYYMFDKNTFPMGYCIYCTQTKMCG